VLYICDIVGDWFFIGAYASSVRVHRRKGKKGKRTSRGAALYIIGCDGNVCGRKHRLRKHRPAPLGRCTSRLSQRPRSRRFFRSPDPRHPRYPLRRAARSNVSSLPPFDRKTRPGVARATVSSRAPASTRVICGIDGRCSERAASADTRECCVNATTMRKHVYPAAAVVSLAVATVLAEQVTTVAKLC